MHQRDLLKKPGERDDHIFSLKSSKVKNLNRFLRKSLTVTPVGNEPVNVILAIGGTCHHVFPVLHTHAASDLTIGVPRQPNPFVSPQVSRILSGRST